MNLTEEWGIRYADDRTPDMSGEPQFITMVVKSEEIAQTATTWTFGQWANRDVQVVRRQVTEWEIVE